MNTAQAAAAVRFVVSNELKDKKAAQAAKKYKVVFSDQDLQEGEDFVGWWIMFPKQTDSTDIVLCALKDSLLGIADPLGKFVAIGDASNVNKKGGKVLGEIGNTGGPQSGVATTLAAAWAAGVYSAAKGTSNEFSVVMGNMAAGGVMHAKQGLETLTGSIQIYDNKSELIQALGSSEKKGVKHCKAKAEAGTKFIIPIPK